MNKQTRYNIFLLTKSCFKAKECRSDWENFSRSHIRVYRCVCVCVCDREERPSSFPKLPKSENIQQLMNEITTITGYQSLQF